MTWVLKICQLETCLSSKLCLTRVGRQLGQTMKNKEEVFLRWFLLGVWKGFYEVVPSWEFGQGTGVNTPTTLKSTKGFSAARNCQDLGFKSPLLKCNYLFSTVPLEQLCEMLLWDSQKSPGEQAKKNIYILSGADSLSTLLSFSSCFTTNRICIRAAQLSEPGSSQPLSLSLSHCGDVTFGHLSTRSRVLGSQGGHWPHSKHLCAPPGKQRMSSGIAGYCTV